MFLFLWTVARNQKKKVRVCGFAVQPVDMKRSERQKEHSHISHHQLQLSSTFPSDALLISRFDVSPVYCRYGII